MTTRVLADANVLYSRTLRDWLILIQLVPGPYTVYWTEDILAEVVYNYRRNHPTVDGGLITRIRDKITESLEGGRVDDFVIDGAFTGDVNDQHVHAAAVACSAHIVLTNDGGFSAPGLADDLPYEVYAPDDFFVLVDDARPDAVTSVALDQARYFQQNQGSADLPAKLIAAGCPRFAERVRQHLVETW